MERNAMISIIHARTSKLYRCRLCGRIHAGQICLACGSSAIQDRLSGAEYENFLYDITGSTSCRDMTDDQLSHVISILNGIRLDGESEARKKAWKAKRKLISIIRSQASRLFGKSAQVRVDGFCDKCIGKPLERLDETELRKVIGWLRRLEKREKAKRYTEGGQNG